MTDTEVLTLEDIKLRVRWAILHWDSWVPLSSMHMPNLDGQGGNGFSPPEWLTEIEEERLTWEAHVNAHLDCLTADQRYVLAAVQDTRDVVRAATRIDRQYEATKKQFNRAVNQLAEAIERKLSRMSRCQGG